MTDLSVRRAATRQALTAAPLDLLVIGGGIVGAGIARDAALRGLRTALVEQHDFAFGTSSRSSRLLHGGLRYLAQGRLGQVRAASVEKRILHRIAPHLVVPLAFVFPAYADNAHWPLWQLKLGVKLYDLLCGGQNFGRSTWLSAAETARLVPALTDTGLRGAVRYFDAFTHDARLTLDTLRSAADHGAAVLNYCRFQGADRAAAWSCELEDLLAPAQFSVQARAIVNATGPWADRVPHSRVHLRLTKGVHLVVPRPRVPVPDAIVMTEGRRLLFAIPWGERTILGTTDTDYRGPLDHVTADAADIAYLLGVTNRFFPRAGLTEADVLSTWAGVRPLIARADGGPSDLSRAHQIHNPEPGWWDVAGGKLTTYRLMAEQTVDRVVKWLTGLHRSNGVTRDFTPCRTRDEPLLPRGGAEGVSGILPPPLTREVVEHFCLREWAVHLDDVMLRRAGWHFYLAEAREQTVARVAEWMATLLHWSAAQITRERARYADATGGAAPSHPERR